MIAQTGGRRIVLSHHDFDGLPADLHGLAHAMLASGAEVVKLAVTAGRLVDCLALRAIGEQTRVPMVLIAMGDAGVASRVLASWFGSCWTYAGDNVAPGQVDLQRLQHEFRFRHIGARTAIYGVVGKPVTHSVSPAMHNAAFRAANLDAVYLQQDAFDHIDASMPLERQAESFRFLKTIIDCHYDFGERDLAREFFTRLTSLYKNWNYSAPGTAGYERYRDEIGTLAARHKTYVESRASERQPQP